MTVAYITADRAALLLSIFSNPDDFYAAAPYTFLVASLIILIFGPGRFSLDYVIERKWASTRHNFDGSDGASYDLRRSARDMLPNRNAVCQIVYPRVGVDWLGEPACRSPQGASRDRQQSCGGEGVWLDDQRAIRWRAKAVSQAPTCSTGSSVPVMLCAPITASSLFPLKLDVHVRGGSGVHGGVTYPDGGGYITISLGESTRLRN